MNSGRCPECDAEITLQQPVVLNQRLACPQCGVQLAVLALSPVELDWAFVEPLTDRHWNAGRSLQMQDLISEET